ncbi:pantoate--beta-alanine ligase [Allonocardiopsis opalescens]|uniref:pantoate--beta-alanine ligase n=1 Tax=Allonocardiopsis opalescens TaxID=1144618 RepID=UPI000D04CD15|nr:pantoate--beta-alanine ligase [Allonocardiopsis opalescens]
MVETRRELAELRPHLGTVALVPTMGALHEGHRSLFRLAAEHADTVVASIFVNPLQFGPNEDYERYPRTFDADLEVCAAEGVRAVFAPSTAEMYPAPQVVTVNPGPMGGVLEGEFRPGFFDGVLTVVAKLLNMVRPDTAVFGEKDAQQLALVRRMVRDLALPVRIVGAPTLRDPDGLAVSSRNVYLSPAERTTALALSAALFAARDAADGGGPDRPLAAARTVLREAETADPPLHVDYLTLVDPDTFAEIPGGSAHGGAAILAVAARVGATRLIDNIHLVL